MSGTKRWVMDLEEKFYDDAEKIIKESDTVVEAQKKVEEIRAKDVPFMDVHEVIYQVADVWMDIHGNV